MGWTQAPGIGAKRADAGGGGWVGRAPPPQESPIMGTLRALRPKGPNKSLQGHFKSRLKGL